MTTLYLVSAEDNGIQYWKIGITKHADPLKRDPKRYKEVFATASFETDDAETVEYTMKRHLKEIGCPVGTESIDNRVTLSTAKAIFNQHVDWGIKEISAWADKDDEDLGPIWQDLTAKAKIDIFIADQSERVVSESPMW